MLNCKKGFTFIELIVVVMMVGMMFSAVFSVSYQTYKKYRYYHSLTNLVAKLKQARKESFLYSETKRVYSKDGAIFISDRKFEIDGCFLNIEGEIVFTKSGSEGGIISCICDKYTYTIKITPPYGEVVLE